MRKILLTLPFILLASSPAWSQAMPNSLNMTCAQTKALVDRSGGVVIGTGPNIFDRYVSGQRYCGLDEIATAAWLQTKDQPQCFIGYHCRQSWTRNR